MSGLAPVWDLSLLVVLVEEVVGEVEKQLSTHSLVAVHVTLKIFQQYSTPQPSELFLPINLTIGSRVVLLFTLLLMRINLRSLPTTLSPRLPVLARPGNFEAKSSKSFTENLL